MGQIVQTAADMDYTIPASIEYLRDNGLVHDLIDELRWGNHPYCPRCTSKFAKRVNTTVFRQLYRCLDCDYMFNALSGSIFQGAKMPLYKFLQYFILRGAIGDALELREVAFALNVSHKTASILIKRATDVDMPAGLAIVDRPRANAISAAEAHAAVDDTFFSYCRMRGILVSQLLLKQYLAVVASDQSNMRAYQESALALSRGR